MFIQDLKCDYQTGGILVEYVNKAEARSMSSKLSRSIFGKGELEQFDGYVTGITTVENYLVVGTDIDADGMDQIVEFIKGEADPDEDEKVTNEDFSMGVEGPTGLNQGIPHGGPGKGVIPAPLFGKGKIVTRDDDKKKLKKALDVLDVYGVKVKKTKKVSEDAMPEWFCRNPWTVDDVDHYLYHELGFEGDEVDDIIALNLDLINELLEKGKSPQEVADELDYSTVQNED